MFRLLLTAAGHQVVPSSVAVSTVAAGYPMQSRSLQQQPQTQSVAGMPAASATQRPGSAPTAGHPHASSQAPAQRWDALSQPPASSLGERSYKCLYTSNLSVPPLGIPATTNALLCQVPDILPLGSLPPTTAFICRRSDIVPLGPLCHYITAFEAAE